MTDTTAATQQLFELWRRQVEQSVEAWARVMGQSPAPAPDPAAFWRPVVDQWLQAWARLFAQTPASPDALAQWKQFLDQCIEAWSKALAQAMGTEAFAQLLGRYLDQWLAAYAPLRRTADQATELALSTLGLASRAQLTALAKQLVELEERVERVEDGIQEILRRLDGAPRAPGWRPVERP